MIDMDVVTDEFGDRTIKYDGEVIGWIERGREFIDGHANLKVEFQFTPVDGPAFPVRRGNYAAARQDAADHLKALIKSRAPVG